GDAGMGVGDKVAVVTGAARGIGRATAALFAREGARLVLNDIDAAGLERVTSPLGATNCRGIVGDISREQTSIALAAETVSAFGQIDILVNNAGIHFLKDITEMTVAQWDRLMDINLKSMFLCCKHVIPHMLVRKRAST